MYEQKGRNVGSCLIFFPKMFPSGQWPTSLQLLIHTTNIILDKLVFLSYLSEEKAAGNKSKLLPSSHNSSGFMDSHITRSKSRSQVFWDCSLNDIEPKSMKLSLSTLKKIHGM